MGEGQPLAMPGTPTQEGIICNPQMPKEELER